ncbi:MAG: aldehyde dehydrogenase family protein [Pseudomonadota bacterium]
MTREATERDVAGAVAAAEAAFGVAPFRPGDDAARADLLDALADALAAERHRLVPLADGETQLGADRLYGELLRTVRQMEMCADLARQGAFLAPVIDTAIDAPPPYGRPDIRRINEPLGPVAVFAASNFPFAFSVLGNDVASALAVGCPVVLKAHPGHPETSAAVARIADAILPEGALSVLYGSGYEANLQLVQAPAVRAAGFTGSLGGGRALLDAIGQRPDPIPFFGELGAVNPVIICPAAAKARGAALGETLAMGATMSMGQFCTNPGVILRPKEAAALDETFEAGVGKAPRHALLNGRIEAGFAKGAEALKAVSGVTSRDVGGHMVFTMSAADFVANGIAREEVFGPATLLVSYDGEADLLAAVGKLEGSLTASLHADPEDDALADLVEPGLRRIAGRILYAEISPGVALTDAMVHGGPWPASTRADSSSVGALSLGRWTRPVAYQSCPASRLPAGLDDDNARGLLRLVNGEMTRAAVSDKPAKPADDKGRMKTWRND